MVRRKARKIGVWRRLLQPETVSFNWLLRAALRQAVAALGRQQPFGLLELDLRDLPCNHAVDRVALGMKQLKTGSAEVENCRAVGLMFLLKGRHSLPPGSGCW